MAVPTPAELAAAITAYVDPHALTDFATTGLQVAGDRPVRRLAVAVSANLRSFEDAAAWDSDAILVHHGLFWESEDPENDPAQAFDERRASFLRERGMSLLAYHLPLDAHPEVGNNAEIVRVLGLGSPAHDFAMMPESDVGIGLVAVADPPIPLAELVARSEAQFGQPPMVVATGPDPVCTVAILSGGGSAYLYEAIDRKVDAYISGEGREWAPALAREAGITFIAVGHHASETLGVQALARWATDRFGLETRFFPQENPF